MKKLTLLFIFLINVLNISAIVHEGSCGANASCKLNILTGVISITGK